MGSVGKSLFGGDSSKSSAIGHGAGLVDRRIYENNAEQNANEERLRKQALGDTKLSLANNQLKAATDSGLAQQIAINAANGGGALNQRASMMQTSQLGQSEANKAALVRAQEADAAQSAYEQAVNMRQANLINWQNAALTQESAKMGRKFQAANADLTRTNAIAGATFGAAASAYANRATPSTQGAPTNSTADSIKNIYSSVRGSSDKTLKTSIKKADLSDLVSKIKASEFEYKKPNGEDYQNGKVLGIMAQDLEKSKLGKTLVSDTPHGKMVDLKKAAPIVLASISDLAKQIKELKNKK